MSPSRLFPFLACLLLTAIAWGCTGNVTDPDNSGPIMPLAVGNQWIGRMSYLNSSGSITRTEFDTLRIIAEVAIKGETWYATNYGQLLTLRGDGLWRRPYGGTSPDEWEMHSAKHPANVGDIFETDTFQVAQIGGPPPLYDSLIFISRVSALGATITVPAGTFHATTYGQIIKSLDGHVLTDLEGGDSRYYTAFAPGIGNVKEEYFAFDSTGNSHVTMRWELMEYLLK
jgi:hypothetical protein